MIEITDASIKDLALIQQLARDTFFATYEPLQPKEKVAYLFKLMYNTDALTEQIEKKNHKFIFAKDNSGYLGYASYEHNYRSTGKTKIHKIYIMPNAQGKGVGKELVNAINSAAKQNKSIALLLDVYKHNPAIGFYEKLGFKKTGEQVTEVGNGFVMDDFVMERKV